MGGRGSSFSGTKAGKVPNETYDKRPFIFSSKYATADEKKQWTATVSKFIKNAQVGDVYSTGRDWNGKSSSFTVIMKGGGKKYLKWNDSYKPVVMDRSNVQKYLANGAKLIKREKK